MLEQPRRPAVGAPTAKPAAAGARPGVSRAEVAERIEAVDDQNYFAMLGVEVDAKPEAIEAAYIGLAKVWHPDRLPAELQDLRASVSKIFARMNDAHRVLIDAQKREEYAKLVAQGGGTAREQEMVARVVDSAQTFRKAEILFKKGALADAETLLREAVEADPDPPEYRTLLAWVQALQRGLPPSAASAAAFYRSELTVLDEVIRREPQYERAIFYRAELLKRAGETDKAMRDYRAVAALNPRNIDAAREVRLYDLRKSKGQDGAGAGLLGRLFNRPPAKGPKDR